MIIPRTVFLADVSKYQGYIDWSKMAKYVHGTIIKCGQASGQDPQFYNNWVNARVNKVPRGSYWFWDSRVAPKLQAASWWSWIKDDPGELMHFADYEESYGGTYSGYGNFKIFLEEFKRLSSNIKIGIYTGYYYWISHSPTGAELDYFAQYPLWLAWYTSNPADVIIPKPWTSLILWQYGTTPPHAPVSDYGVQSLEMDSNNFNGDENSYRLYFGLGDTPPPPGVSMIYKCVTAAINVRSGPSTAYGIVQGCKLGDKIDVSEQTNTVPPWFRITKIIKTTGNELFPDAGKQWWVSGSTLYWVSWDWPPPPPPPPPDSTSRVVSVTVEEAGWQTVTATVNQPKA